MPCVVGEDCRMPENTPGPPQFTGHKCRSCKGHLHGICGEEDPAGGSPMPRLCPPCLGRVTTNKRKEISDDASSNKRVGSEKRVRLTIQQKGEVLDMLKQNNMTQAMVGEKFGIKGRTIQRIKKEEESIRKQLEVGGNGNAKSMRKPQFPEVDNMTATFLEETRKANLSVTRASLQTFGKKAKEALVVQGGLEDRVRERLDAFTASDKWVRNFVQRKGLQGKSLHGEEIRTDNGTIADGIKSIRSICAGYPLTHIYGVDETVLFYNLLPRKIYLVEQEQQGTVRETRWMKAEDRFSALLCTNASGKHKIPLTIIGNTKDPLCFRQRKPAVNYLSQPRAWPDQQTFRVWFFEVFLPCVRDITDQKVLLLVGNCGSQGALEDPLGQVSMKECLPTCTRKHQPMGLGVISAWKMLYRAKLLSARANALGVPELLCLQVKDRDMPQGTVGLAEGQGAHLLDAADMAKEAWDELDEVSIVSSWLKANVFGPPQAAQLGGGRVGPAGHGSQDAVLQVLAGAITGLSLGVWEQQRRRQSGIDAGIVGALASLGITPGQSASPETMKVAQQWVRVEEEDEVGEALRRDLGDELMEHSLALGLAGKGQGESGAQGGQARAQSRAPPSIEQLEKMEFGQLEAVAEECNIGPACKALRRARMAFMDAYADYSRQELER